MRLDMRINAQISVCDSVIPDIQTTTKQLLSDILPGCAELKTISVELAHWQQINAVHGWFCSRFPGIYNNSYTPVALDDLVSLKTSIQEVISDPDSADRILPTVPGYGFGSREYNDQYFQKLDTVLCSLDKIIYDPGICVWKLFYLCSW